MRGKNKVPHNLAHRKKKKMKTKGRLTVCGLVYGQNRAIPFASKIKGTRYVLWAENTYKQYISRSTRLAAPRLAQFATWCEVQALRSVNLLVDRSVRRSVSRWSSTCSVGRSFSRSVGRSVGWSAVRARGFMGGRVCGRASSV